MSRTALPLVLFAFLLFAEDYHAERQRLVRDSMEGRGIRHLSVLRAMRETPRHEFMPLDVRRYSY